LLLFVASFIIEKIEIFFMNLPHLEHIAFYKLHPIDQPQSLAAQLRAIAAPLLGSILVAHEGINGALSGLTAQLDAFEKKLRQDARFADLGFKRSFCHQNPYGRLKVQIKPQLVAVGIPIPAHQLSSLPGGQRVDPLKWRHLLQEEQVVVLDNRNDFEYRLGHFRTALNPQVNHFRDFPSFVQTHAATWRAADKKVAMYCTGGIRCEKLSSWMTHEMGLNVYSLEGGILNYFQKTPDAEKDFEGECFMFDSRLALNTRLQPTATQVTDIYCPTRDGAWRLERAQRLSGSF
jgi:UPF0176 protein